MGLILGYFVFIDLGNGCLGSKFGHLGLPYLLTESAVKRPQPVLHDIWVGDYDSLWLDSSNPPTQTLGRLLIRPRSASQYLLEWRDERNFDNEPLFGGEGMISNGQLVGSYWNAAIQRSLPNRPDLRQVPINP